MRNGKMRSCLIINKTMKIITRRLLSGIVEGEYDDEYPRSSIKKFKTINNKLSACHSNDAEWASDNARCRPIRFRGIMSWIL